MGIHFKALRREFPKYEWRGHSIGGDRYMYTGKKGNRVVIVRKSILRGGEPEWCVHTSDGEIMPYEEFVARETGT